MSSNQNDALPNKSNPYLQSKTLWNDMYGSVQTKLQNAYRILLLLTIVIVILVTGLVIVTGRSEIKPYLTVIKGSDVLTVHEFESQEAQQYEATLTQLLAKQFIQQVRSMSSDNHVNQQNRVKAFSMASGETTQRLKAYFREDAHQQKDITREVIIQTVLIKSEHTMTLRWQEISRSANSGEVIKQAHYSAELTCQFSQDNHSDYQKRYNPMGFYITHLAWAEDLIV